MIKPDLNIHHERNIKRIRELLGYKQEFLAIELDITQQSISEIERKEFDNKKTLMKIADILQVPIEVIENLNNKKMVDIKHEFIKNFIVDNEKGLQGKVIKSIREHLNIPVSEIALKLGINKQEYLELEKKEKLDAEILEKIAKALNIPVEAIIELEQGTTVNIVANTFTDFKYNAVANQNYPTFNTVDKIVELYDKLLETERDKVRLMEEVLKGRG
ncbi:helix-turn-helix transcriptional regulator [Apibacter sp. HY039]|uniref:helix-turn-helix transcriptional regulator n=1 Tax=Apibacter sp. HY039 TaxID=2501476 RepID=UPI000FEBFF75|nr:helix-turn-helix transcriptional regulator [Apibacter sp. HY039]